MVCCHGNHSASNSREIQARIAFLTFVYFYRVKCLFKLMHGAYVCIQLYILHHNIIMRVTKAP